MSSLKAGAHALISPALVAALVLVAGGTATAQAGITYAIVTQSYGSVVGQLAGSGIGASVPVPVNAQIYSPATGKTSPAPAGTKYVPQYTITNSGGLTLSQLVGRKPPITCSPGHLPQLVLPASGPRSVMAASNWHCAVFGGG